MGLEELLGRIQEQTKEQSAKIIAGAKAEAERVTSAAKENARAITSQAKAQAERDVRDEKLRSVASARLGAKRQLLQAQEEVLQGYEAKVLSSVEEFVKSGEYTKFLTHVIDDGVAKIGKGAVVHLNAKDMHLLKEKVNFKISEKPIECVGGALVSSDDGKRRVDNTIESLLREKRDELRLKLSEQIFGASRTGT